MPAAKRRPAAPKPVPTKAQSPALGKVWPLVSLSHEGKPIPMDTDLREILPEVVVEACLRRGEASTTKPA